MMNDTFLAACLLFPQKDNFFLTYNLPWLQQHFNLFWCILRCLCYFDFGVLCLVWSFNFQPITELSYKIAQSRNLAFPAQSADSHPRLHHDGYATDHQRAWWVEKSVCDVNKNMSGVEVKPTNSKFWSQRVILLSIL